MELRPFQKPALDHLLKVLARNRSAAIAWEMGLGKTVISCAVAKTMGLPVMVICPKTLQTNWSRTLQAFGIPNARVIGYEKALRNKVELVRSTPSESLVIFDEAHRMKSSKSQTGKLGLLFKRCYTLLLSATLCESPLDMRYVGALLGIYSGSYYKFAYEHGCKNGMFGGLEFNGSPKEILKLHSYVFPSRGSFLQIKDVPEMRENLVLSEPIDLGSGEEIQKIYNLLGLELDALQQRIEEYIKTPLTDQQAARQRVELLKVPGTLELIEDAVEEGRSVAVFANYLATIDAMANKLKTCVVIRGNQSLEERASAVDSFQAGLAKVILVQAGAGAEGLNLGDTTGKHPRLALIFPSFNARQTAQCIGRVGRLSSVSDSVSRILIAANTIEERVYEVYEEKTANIGRFNSGRELPAPSTNTRTGACAGAGPTTAGRETQMASSGGSVLSGIGSGSGRSGPAQSAFETDDGENIIM